MYDDVASKKDGEKAQLSCAGEVLARPRTPNPQSRAFSQGPNFILPPTISHFTERQPKIYLVPNLFFKQMDPEPKTLEQASVIGLHVKEEEHSLTGEDGNPVIGVQATLRNP